MRTEGPCPVKGASWFHLSDSWVKVMSSVWVLVKLWQKRASELLQRFAVGVHRATNRGPSVGRAGDKDGAWNLPLTNMEQQLPCCSLKALEVCMQHMKLLSKERQREWKLNF